MNLDFAQVFRIPKPVMSSNATSESFLQTLTTPSSSTFSLAQFPILIFYREYLMSLITHISHFLSEKLRLELHPDKVFIKTIASGVDFLGWVHFPTHRVLRKSTKRRMLARVNEKNIASYLGLLKYGDTYKIHNTICRALLLYKQKNI